MVKFLVLFVLILIGGGNSLDNDEENIFERTYKQIPTVTYNVANFGESRINQSIKLMPFNLPPGYDKTIIPSASYASSLSQSPFLQIYKKLDNKDESVMKVNVTMRVLEISDVDEHEEEIIFLADLMVSWRDYVISRHTMTNFSYSKTDSYFQDEFTREETGPLYRNLDLEDLQKIWKPDLFIAHLVKVRQPEIMNEPVSLRLNPLTGAVLYVARLRIRMVCDMDFQYYPADTQECPVIIRSNTYSSEELILEWPKYYGAFLEDVEEHNYDLQLSNANHSFQSERYVHSTMRNFSVLDFKLMARRKLSYHMVGTFVPSTFYIIITWLCFLVPSRMVEARIGISMTTLLTLTSMFASVRENTPHVSYVRAIDIWMLVSIFFVFLTLLEFSVLLWLRSLKEDTVEAATKSPQDEAIVEPKPRSRTHGICKPQLSLSPSENARLKLTFSHRNRRRRYSWRKQAKALGNTSEFIEKYAFLIFSTMFTIFVIIFWSWLLISSGYYDWKVNCNVNNCYGKSLKAQNPVETQKV